MAEAVYDSDWTAADIRIQKMLVLVLQRGQAAQILTGMDFFVASFPTLSKVFKRISIHCGGM